jgi:hypothetical protein
MCRLLLYQPVVIGLSGLIIACSAIKEASPDDYLDKARELIKAQEYQSAKKYIDSVSILFPKDYDKIREGMAVMREVNYYEQKKTLSYCDSLLKIRQAELPEVSQSFVFQKDPEFESIGHYVHKKQLTENNSGRTYLQFKVDEHGKLIITSFFCGSSPLYHSSIRVSTKDGLYAETIPVPRDGAMNYSFKDNGLVYEMVRFNNKTENGVVNFILLHQQVPVKVELIGRRKVVYYLSEQDKKILKEATDLSAVLLDINRLLDEIRLAQAKIDYLLKQQLKNKLAQ